MRVSAANSWLVWVLVIATAPITVGADDSEVIWTRLVHPSDGSDVIGKTEVEADVVSREEIRDVVFFVDGRPIGMLTTAPFRMQVDLGSQNRSHTIEVVATDVDGRQARDQVTTTPVPVGGEYEVDLQQLYVTVTRGGERVLDLGRENFAIVDEGRKQELVTFAGGDVPFTAALLIDASASMYGSKLEAARAGATAFIDGMRDLDHGKVVVFSDVIQNSTPFSGVRDVLTAGLIGATGQGGTAINDNLYAALKLLTTRQGRRLVVLLSDGVDSQSALDGQDVLEFARRSQAMVYWIRLLKPDESLEEENRPQLASAWRTPADYRRQESSLQKVVELTGGRTIPVRSADDITPVFIEILRELREQYALGYYPTVHRKDGSWHGVKVRVDLLNVEVRTTEGYLDY
jgi:Ca-activated chloride channel family protein